MNYCGEYCKIIAVNHRCGVKHMKNELQKLKEKLDHMLIETSPVSQEVLKISKELDILIIEYYKQGNYSESIRNTVTKFA